MTQSMKVITAKITVHLTVLSLIVVFLMACSSPYEEVLTKDENDNPISSYTVRKTDGVKEGIYKLYIDGKTSEEGTYKNGQQDGIRKLFFDNGKIQVEEVYKEGQLTAKKTYFANGTIESEGQYDEAMTMTGEWKYYYSQNGKLKESVQFKNNVEDGLYKEYYENGNIKAEGNYIPMEFGIESEGVADGLWKEYNQKGELIAKKECELGRCKTIWTKEGNN